MKKIYYLLFSLSLLACNSRPAQDKTNIHSDSTGIIKDSLQAPVVKDEREQTAEQKFLWREDQYDEELKDTFNMIRINEDLAKNLSDPERAAIGYVATFIGNECQWDGPYKDDRSNLKCKILTALQLGYQCSEQHIGFLKKWFKDDKAVLEELQGCPTIPDGATIQNTFDEISFKKEGDKLAVNFKVSGHNMREGKSWKWVETDYFQINGNTIKYIKKDKRKVTP
ncbi:hypothetical protein HMPREF0765_1008 [Sphingobacterium spiritivorum ATCC 33300]|uniref:Lipoprotein n=1 Tax=Sphingobacterium spiritivorum ATCC 33300 TaxID=525372 RepID=C2FUK2_SPHSI|nr:hypothetical protein [Sphingobacterium spiritivorum]EEI93399.1 hypothetical protein HMPREF0765_1008 [Sphingobacterium spiritivorum ATCC 33300]QQS95914.1 hypothetical protein I6J03_21490 [Sphingobacterium spiritivorum]